jgi:hypothetical protein
LNGTGKLAGLFIHRRSAAQRGPVRVEGRCGRGKGVKNSIIAQIFLLKKPDNII